MTARLRSAKINVKAVVILLCIVVVIGTAAVVGRQVRRRIIADNALTAAKTALEQEDWTEASKQLNHYLNRRPEDLDMLEEYARVNLKIRPREPKHVLTAIGAYRMLLREKPGDAMVSHQLADLYNMVAKYTEAEHVCQQRLDVAPDDAKARIGLGLARFHLREFDKATEVLSALVAAHPDQVQAYALLATIALERTEGPSKQEAADWLDRSVDSNPQSAAARIHRARFRREAMNDPTGARGDLEQATLAPIAKANERLAQANEWIAVGDLEAAGEAIQAAEDASTTESAGDDFDAGGFAVSKFLLAARLAMIRKDAEATLALADDAMGTLPATHRLLFLPTIIDLYLQGGRTENARSALETFRQLVDDRGNRNDRLSHTLTVAEAAVLAAEGHPYRVIELLEPFVAENPKTPIAWKMLWLALDRTEQPRRALAALDSYLDLNGNDADALTEAARAYQDRSPAKADAYASRALRLRSDDPDAKLLSLEARAAEAGTAEERNTINAELEPILAADPGNQAAYALRINLLLRLGRSEEAEQALRLAEAQSTDPVAARLMHLRFLARSGRAEEAESLCRQAVKEHPDSTSLRIMLAQLQVAVGKPEDARQTLQQSLGAFTGADLTRIESAFTDFLLSRGESEAAVAPLLRIAAREPDNLRARALLLDREEIAKDPEVSRRLIDEMRRIEGDQGLRWQLEDVRLRLRQDDWKEDRDTLVETLQACLRRDPGWSKAAVILGRVYEALGRDEDAVETYRNTYAADPTGASIALVDRLVSVLIRKARFTDAQDVLSRFPETVAKLRMHRVDVALGQHDPATAIGELRRRIQEDPKDAGSMVLLAALTYVQTNSAQPSFDLLDRAADVPGDPKKIMQTRVYILHAEKRDEDALALIDEHIDRSKDRAAYLFRASFFEALQRTDQAERDYRHAATMPPPTAEGYVALGDFFFRLAQTDDAVEAWREASALEPDNVGNELRLIAALLSSTGKAQQQEGRQRLGEFLKQSPNDPRGLYLSARAEIAAGSYGAIDRAARSLEAAIRVDPRFTPAHLELLRIAQRSGNPTKVEACLRTARRLGVQNPEFDLAEATIEADRGKPIIAESLARTIIERHPDYVPARLLLAGIKLQTEGPAGAMGFVEQALEINPNSSQAVIAQAEILIAQGKKDAAATRLQDYCERTEGPGAMPVILRLAALQMGRGDFDAAESNVAKAERLAPGSVRAGRARIDLLARRKRFAEISALADRETSADVERLEIITRAASTLSGAPDEKYRMQAVALFQRALAAMPENPRLMLALGQVYLATKQLGKAADAYRKLLDVDPQNFEALNDLAWILAIEMNKPDEGLKLADKGLQAAPTNTNLLDTRGVIHFMLGNLDQSRKDLEACAKRPLAHPSTHARALFHLARTLAAVGDHPAARLRLEQARRIDESQDVFTDKEHAEIAKLMKTISG